MSKIFSYQTIILWGLKKRAIIQPSASLTPEANSKIKSTHIIITINTDK